MVPRHLHASPLPVGSSPHCHSAGHSAPGGKGEGTSCDLPQPVFASMPLPPWPVHTSLYQHSLRPPCQAILQARQTLGVFFPRKTSRAGAKGGTSLFLTHHFLCLLSPSWGQSRCIVSGRGALDPSPSSTHGVPQTLVRGFVELPSASQLHPFWVGFDCPYIWTRGAQHDLCQGRCVADMDGLMGCLLPTCDPHHCEMHSSPFQMSPDPEGVRDLSKVTKQKMAE